MERELWIKSRILSALWNKIPVFLLYKMFGVFLNYFIFFEKLMDMGNDHLLMGPQHVLFQLNHDIQM